MNEKLKGKVKMVNLTLGDWIDQMNKVSNEKLRLESNARKLAMVLAYIFVALF